MCWFLPMASNMHFNFAPSCICISTCNNINKSVKSPHKDLWQECSRTVWGVKLQIRFYQYSLFCVLLFSTINITARWSSQTWITYVLLLTDTTSGFKQKVWFMYCMTLRKHKIYLVMCNFSTSDIKVLLSEKKKQETIHPTWSTPWWLMAPFMCEARQKVNNIETWMKQMPSLDYQLWILIRWCFECLQCYENLNPQCITDNMWRFEPLLCFAVFRHLPIFKKCLLPGQKYGK